ncbi:hypothetical protein [Zoogloea sp.]|uniref:hypothetical protein n=1 Tax=Zoogloea sp. TaxID=49181 RepID=UPI00321F9F38
MPRLILCIILLVVSGLAAAQYLSEEEYWRRVYGFDMTELNDFKADVRQRADRVNALEAQLKRCGNCADRARLAGELERQDAELRRMLSPMCSAMMSFSGIGFGASNGVEQISEMTGIAPLCREVGKRVREQAQRETQAIERAEWEAKARSGRPEDILMLGLYYALTEQRIDLACPYFLQASRKGHTPAVKWLSRCDFAQTRESFELTKACAEKGEMECMHIYGWYFTSLRPPSSPSPVAVDDDEALRWLDRAAEKGMRVAKLDAARLRQKMSGAEAPPEPAPAPAAQPSPPARPAPVYVAKPRRTGQEAACERLLERLERDRQRAATRPQDVGVQRALANLEQRYSAGCR